MRCLRRAHWEKIKMKLATLSFGVLFSALSAGTASAGPSEATPRPFCLEASSVRATDVVDERTILYRMRDGKVWKNTLKQDCPNLKFRRGFSEIVRSGQICANRQIIAVLGTNNTCQLGDFTPVSHSSP
jgi:hypothetical protein